MTNNKTFIFEGITGSGKSTQIHLLTHRVQDLNPQLLDRSSPIIDAMKETRELISKAGNPIVAQSLSYIVENVAKVEIADKHEGIIIIDRFVLSNAVYLIARAINEALYVDRDAVRKTIFTPFGVNLLQDKTIIYLDCDPKEAQYRTTTRRNRKKFDLNLHILARQAYREELDKLETPYHKLDTTYRKPEDINQEIEYIIRRGIT